jgi:hypothetical protein
MTRARDLASGINGVRPFAMAAGTATSTSSGFVTVTFPAGRFTQAPRVVASVNNAEAFAFVGTPSTSSFTTNAFANFYGQLNNWLAGFTISYVAVQMTSGASSG